VAVKLHNYTAESKQTFVPLIECRREISFFTALQLSWHGSALLARTEDLPLHISEISNNYGENTFSNENVFLQQ
jgi:hypothetical protein